MKTNQPEKKKKNGKIVKPVILAACAAIVGLSVYADWSYANKTSQETGSYIYNSSVSGEKAKLLGEATYVGTSSNEDSNIASIDSAESYFAGAMLERQRTRDETLDLLQTVVDSSETMPDAKNKALSDMTEIASAMQAETNIETLVKAKGFEDCLAVVGSEDVNVIVKTTGLLTYEVAQIREIVMNELDIPADKIKIIEKIN